MPYRVCSTPGCPTLHEGTGRCAACEAKAERKRRPKGNPYNTPGHRAFREAVLARNPWCSTCHTSPSTVADHWPDERRDLVNAGLDPDEPSRGRGLCKKCHDRHTAATSRGGWRNETR